VTCGRVWDMLVYSASWFNLPFIDAQGHDLNALFSAQEHRFGIHGGDIETSMMLALAPGQVVTCARRSTLLCKCRGCGRRSLTFWAMAKVPSWAGRCRTTTRQVPWAMPAAASADKGRALLDAAGRALAQLLAEMDQLPGDTLRDDLAV
jgi:creatinine amidohydrolase